MPNSVAEIDVSSKDANPLTSPRLMFTAAPLVMVALVGGAAAARAVFGASDSGCYSDVGSQLRARLGEGLRRWIPYMEVR